MKFLRAILAAFGPREVSLIAGLGLVGYGAWCIYPPAAFVIPGAIIVAVAVFGLR